MGKSGRIVISGAEYLHGRHHGMALAVAIGWFAAVYVLQHFFS